MKIRAMRSLAWLALLLLLVPPAWGADRVFLPGVVPAVVARLTPLGPLPATNRLNLAIGLPLRNEAALTNLLQQMYDPGSTNFHRYLTPDQFTAEFGPTEEDYQRVLAFAEAHGLSVTKTYANRKLVDVTGSVADIDTTFQIRLLRYEHPTEHREFFAPDTEPSVTAGVPILSVSGLSNYQRPHPATPGHARAPVQGTIARYHRPGKTLMAFVSNTVVKGAVLVKLVTVIQLDWARLVETWRV